MVDKLRSLVGKENTVIVKGDRDVPGTLSLEGVSKAENFIFFSGTSFFS
jgi:hypothetical protein